ncbi:MAG: nucleotidyltransferase [Deltaproteobacteria bacterium]|nr:nucleotidyltransferase [Deltaproteobacteria bacterium]
MEKIEFHPDFKDFLKLLNSHGVEYLIVGGYAVGLHGYPRATGDMDIWIAVDPSTAKKVANVVREFGMPEELITEDLFLQRDKVIRMGVPPVRIELITGASGVNFSECYSRREVVEIDCVQVNFICLEDLKVNKKASARHKDLEDLEHLP